MIILSSLPKSWDPIVGTLYTATSPAALIAALKTHWLRIRSCEPNAPTALQVRAKPLNPRNQLLCTNPNCKQRGHSIENCYWQGGGKEGQFPPGFGRRGGGGGNALTTNMATNTTVAVANTSMEASYVLMVITELPPNDLPTTRAFLTTMTQTRTYADSGTTDHCFANREEFITYLAYNPPHTGRTANKDGTFRILGVGEVRCTFTYNGCHTHLTFKAAVHAPDLSANLISISKFDDLGFYTTFGGRKVIFLDATKQVMMEGHWVGGMYLLDMMGTPPTATGPGTVVMSARSHEKPIGINTWHR